MVCHSPMKPSRLFLLSLVPLAVVAWVVLSMQFMWPPICREVIHSYNACINNLRQIDGAKQQWATENAKTNGANVTLEDLKDYLRNRLSCPYRGTYTINPIGQPPTCSVAEQKPKKRHDGPLHWEWEVPPASGHKLSPLD
jgi:hypothetical protein